MIDLNHCYVGDCRRLMRDWIRDGIKVQMVVTSPPYWGLRDYDIDPDNLPLQRDRLRQQCLEL